MRNRTFAWASLHANSIIIHLATYLMAFVAAIRAYLVYPHQWIVMTVFLVPYFLLLTLEGIVNRLKPAFSLVYVGVQILIMVGLYMAVPYADYWALLLFPACSFVMRRFSRTTGYSLVLFFTVAMAIMIKLAEGDFAMEFIPIYLVGYLLVSTFSLALQQTTEAKENAEDLSNRLTEANKRLQQYTERVRQLAVLEERTSLARNLHDSATQTLFSANLLLSSLENKHKNSSEELVEDINKISRLTQGAMTQLRNLIKQLQPETKPGQNFHADLDRFVSGLKENHNFTIHCDLAAPEIPLLYRPGILAIIQEALFNSLKHSGTKESNLSIQKTDSGITVIISDEGKGFDMKKGVPEGHLGIEGIKVVSLEIGADLQIISKPGQGCSIRLFIPLKGGFAHGS